MSSSTSYLAVFLSAVIYQNISVSGPLPPPHLPVLVPHNMYKQITPPSDRRKLSKYYSILYNLGNILPFLQTAFTFMYTCGSSAESFYFKQIKDYL